MTKELRNPAIFLPLSLRFTKEYLKQLCEMRNKYKEDQIQESKELTIIHRALWTALLVEVRKLFEDSKFDNYSLRKINFFKQEPHKSKIDQVFGDADMAKILKTTYTFTTHLSKNKENMYSVSEICNSKLGILLEELQEPINALERTTHTN